MGEDIRKLKYGVHVDESDEMMSRGFKDQIYDVCGYFPPDLQLDLNNAGSYSLNGLDDEKEDVQEKARFMEDMMNGIFEGFYERLDKLTDTVHPFSFGKQLHQSVMEVQGFNERFLNMDFRYLMKDRTEAEIFVLTNEEGKRHILNDLCTRIRN
ncbi:hypothetical protein AQUCO_04300043v1 [Aquilegia coerulea]|uniref:Uncharacterized protein n=1 Tax=Aquilegia coerulea TaxID=218851 RepID=A0A2G5CNE3_AQUCA|nr:hypothetical protein AQUCO_04300043v1 [Aquilegia coerulea]